MYGIDGFIGFDNYIKLAVSTNKVQKHRGPDKQSVWNDDYIAMAHQRTSIIDLSPAANRPFLKDDLVIFYGIIYNELKKLISNKQVVIQTNSDIKEYIDK